MSYYSHLSGGLGCGCDYGKDLAVAEYDRCRHGCHSSYSAR
ncbi:putative keratin-associated protein 20-4 [Symphalangus syndactylus]